MVDAVDTPAAFRHPRWLTTPVIIGGSIALFWITAASASPPRKPPMAPSVAPIVTAEAITASAIGSE